MHIHVYHYRGCFPVNITPSRACVHDLLQRYHHYGMPATVTYCGPMLSCEDVSGEGYLLSGRCWHSLTGIFSCPLVIVHHRQQYPPVWNIFSNTHISCHTTDDISDTCSLYMCKVGDGVTCHEHGEFSSGNWDGWWHYRAVNSTWSCHAPYIYQVSTTLHLLVVSLLHVMWDQSLQWNSTNFGDYF